MKLIITLVVLITFFHGTVFGQGFYSFYQSQQRRGYGGGYRPMAPPPPTSKELQEHYSKEFCERCPNEFMEIFTQASQVELILAYFSNQYKKLEPLPVGSCFDLITLREKINVYKKIRKSRPLQFYGNINFPLHQTYDFDGYQAKMANLSAIHYDSKEGILYSVSDRVPLGDPHIFRFKVSFSNGKIKLIPLDTITLKNAQGSPLNVDAEGMVVDHQGNIFIASESLSKSLDELGDQAKGQYNFGHDAVGTEVLQFNPNGTLIKKLDVPSHFQSLDMHIERPQGVLIDSDAIDRSLETGHMASILKKVHVRLPKAPIISEDIPSDQQNLLHKLLPDRFFGIPSKRHPTYNKEALEVGLQEHLDSIRLIAEKKIQGTIKNYHGNRINNKVKDKARADILSITDEYKRNVAQAYQDFETQMNSPYPFGHDHNLGTEGISLTPNGDTMYLASEEVLKQDKDDMIRISRKSSKNGEWQSYAYQRDPPFGVSDILAIDENSLFVMEKYYFPNEPNLEGKEGKVVVNIYKATIPTGLTPIESTQAWKQDLGPHQMKKELVFSFDEWENEFNTENEGYRRTDNLEGITFGPPLPNGNPSILIMGDNNIQLPYGQRTQFHVLEIKR